MPKDLQLKASLARWFSSQSKFSNLRGMADAIGMPFNTLRGYFSGKKPNSQNLVILKEVTGLDLDTGLPRKDQPVERPQSLLTASKDRKISASTLLDDLHFDLIRCLTNIPPVQNALAPGIRPKAAALKRRAQIVRLLMDAIQRNLSPFLEDPKALKTLRETISGSDAAYISGLLASICDDRRLQTWQQLTTYKYGSK